jgi:hypothetical protein
VPAVAATAVVVLTAGAQGECANGCSFTLTSKYQFETATTPSIVFGVSGQTGVTIPAGGGTSSAIPVTALTTGSIGNVPAGAISLCPSTSASGDWCTTLDLQATNPAAATGGVDGGAQTVASASDIANWQEQLGQVENQLGAKAASYLTTKAGQEKVAIDPNGGGKSLTFVVSPSTFPPANPSTVMTATTVTVTMTAQETLYNPADLNAVVLKDLQASSNLPAGDSLVPAQLQLNNVQIIQAGSDGSFALSLSAVDYYHGKVDLTQLKSQLSGRSPGSVPGIVKQAIPNVHSVTVDETPVQFLFMPFSGSSIHIVETFVTGGSGSSASG